MKILFCAFLLIYNISFAQVSLIGEGKYLSLPDEPMSFVKDQLLFEAFKDVISKDLDALGYEPSKLWNHLEERFEARFKSTEEEFKTNNDFINPNLSEAKKADLMTQLRYLKLQERVRFYSLDRFFKKWGIDQRVSRSTTNPNLRFMTIKADIDRKEMSSYYLTITGNKQKTDFENMYLGLTLSAADFSWADLEVSNVDELKDAILKEWIKHIGDKKIGQVGQILEAPMDLYQSMELGSEVSSQYKNSLFFQIKVKINKVEGSSYFRENKFRYNTFLVLKDFSRDEVIFEELLNESKQEYRLLTIEELRNQIANAIYRLPLDSFESLKKTLASLEPVKNKIKVSIRDISSMGQLLDISQKLESHGVRFGLDTHIESYDGTKALILIEHKSQEPKLLTLLEDFSQNYINDKHVISFNKEVKEFSIQQKPSVVVEQ